jgi:hypothetical protein
MIRRFIFDPATNAVVEIGLVRSAPDGRTRYADAHATYRETVNRDPSEEAGARFRAATLERSDRREFAHRRYGNEHRWRD